MLMLASFAFQFGWFPAGGANESRRRTSTNDRARVFSIDYWSHLVLPALTLAIYLQGLPLLLMRATMLEVMRDEFIMMAQMKGLSRSSILLRHAARNALLPVATAFALGLGAASAATWWSRRCSPGPASGRVLVQAVQGRRLPAGAGGVPDHHLRAGIS